ncbi:MAG: hypothetical protein ACXVB9_11525 [Bdellovibrionota bacterium]
MLPRSNREIPRLVFWLSLFGLFSAPAFALPSMEPKLKDHEIRVGLQGNGYLTPTDEPNSDIGTGNTALTVGVRGVGEKNNFHFAVEGESLYGLRHANYRYVDVNELYMGVEKKDAPTHASIYLGRKRYEWSDLDSYWSLGLFDPRFRWDYLNERESGLLGIFPGFSTPYFQATAFFSPVFIPEQGAPFDISGGNCHSSSPWFSCPTSSIRVFNQPTNVNFSLDVPPVRDLIMHEGHGATIRAGADTGPFARASYTHKPMNQFLLSFEGRLNLDTSSVPAVIRPRVLYHDLYGLDLGYNSANLRHSVTASAIAERPIRDVTPSTWNTQETANAQLYGITARTHPFEGVKFTRMEVSYLHRDGGDAADQGPFVSPGVNYFEPRYAFKNAISVAGFTPIFDNWARKFEISSKFIVDTANTGNILVFDTYYSPVVRVVLNFGVDLLGSNNPSPVDFISRYQRNDRVRGGVSYAF